MLIKRDIEKSFRFPLSRAVNELSTTSETTNAWRFDGIQKGMLSTKKKGRILNTEYSTPYILSTLIPHDMK